MPNVLGTNHNANTICADMTKMVIDGAGSTGSLIGPLHYAVLSGKSARDRMQERLLRRLHQEFPLTEVMNHIRNEEAF